MLLTHVPDPLRWSVSDPHTDSGKASLSLPFVPVRQWAMVWTARPGRPTRLAGSLEGFAIRRPHVRRSCPEAAAKGAEEVCLNSHARPLSRIVSFSFMAA